MCACTNFVKISENYKKKEQKITFLKELKNEQLLSKEVHGNSCLTIFTWRGLVRHHPLGYLVSIRLNFLCAKV